MSQNDTQAQDSGKPDQNQKQPILLHRLPEETKSVDNADITLRTEADLLERKLELFGRNVGEIPCFRNSFLYGISSGFGSGLLYFAFTSRIRQATNFGFYTYLGVTFCYWCGCRYRFSKTKMEYQLAQYAMQQNALYEGTEKGMKIDRDK